MGSCHTGTHICLHANQQHSNSFHSNIGHALEADHRGTADEISSKMYFDKWWLLSWWLSHIFGNPNSTFSFKKKEVSIKFKKKKQHM